MTFASFSNAWATWPSVVLGPYELSESYGHVARWKSVLNHPHAILWLHAYGFSACSLTTGSQGLCMQAPCVRPRAEAIQCIRACEHPHGQSCRAVRGPMRPVSAPSCYIYQVNPDYVQFVRPPQGGIPVFYRYKFIRRPCMKIVHAQLSAFKITLHNSYAHSSQIKLGAYVIMLVSSRSCSYITVVTYFHNNFWIGCVETIIIKTSLFEAKIKITQNKCCYIYQKWVSSWMVQRSAEVVERSTEFIRN